MMSRFIFAAAIIFAFFAACRQGEKKANPADTALDPAMVTSIQWLDSTLDKGTVTEGEKVEVAYRFKNSGSKPLVIKDVRPSCGCTVAEKPEKPIAPGEEGIIKGVFNSTNKVGTNNKTIHVVANTQPDISTLKFTVVVNKKS
jgi:hypothetical protein